MKPTVKIASLLLAVVMLFAAIASGCTINKEWSYKTSDKELPIGVYIYSLYNAYNRALSYAEKLDDYDSTKDSWLDMEITDDDGNKEVASKWIKEQAEELCLEMLAVDAELKKLDASPDEAMIESLDQNAESNWNFGTTYTQYIGYFTPLKTTLEPYGISYESYRMVASDFSAAEETLFDKLYFEGGSKEVSKEEIEKYFEENYVRYAYLPVPLYESKTDEESGESTNTAYSEDKIKELTTALDSYAKEVNAVSDTAKAAEKSEKLIADFITANGLTEDSLVKNTAKKDETNVGEEVDKIISELGEGKAKTVKVGEGDSATYYYVFRYNTKAAKDDYLTSGENDHTIIGKMKQKDFEAYLKELAKALEHEKNSAVDSYDPKMFFVAKEPETTESESTEDEK